MSSKVFDIITKEQFRQDNTIELIASENFTSENVRKAVGSILSHKYCEGYPATRPEGRGRAGRYYGGCQYYDELENYCNETWKKAFKTNYHCNCQPHSGSQANACVYASVLKPGDTILSMSLAAGGHLTHSAPVSFVSKIYNVVTYGLDNDGYIDYDDVLRKIQVYKPKLVVCGASSYSREIDYQRFAYWAHESGALLMADIAHVAGLIVAGVHESPFGYADIITTTTHKTLRGPRGALIFCKPELANQVDSAVFPGNQGGPLMNIIAGKAVAAEEACTKEYREYIQQVVKNAKAMAHRFKELGYNIVSDGTDNHMFLLDLTPKGVSGLQVQTACEKAGIILNKNMIPNDTRSPKETSGVRIGTPAETSRGWREQDFIACANRIDEIISEI